MPARVILYPAPCGKHHILCGFFIARVRETAFLEGLGEGGAGPGRLWVIAEAGLWAQISDCRFQIADFNTNRHKLTGKAQGFNLQSEICILQSPKMQ